MSTTNKKIAVVGAGPVGALLCCYLSKYGYQIDLYEGRSDIRLDKNAGGNSINLSLSERGRNALRGVNLENYVVGLGTKMTGRMIHQNTKNGDCFSVPYGTTDQHYLLSVNRLLLNKEMITLAERCKNVSLHFSHKLVSSNLKENILEFKTPDGPKTSEKYDFVFGCDGIWSNVRRQQMREGKVNFSQTYITHSYKELILPAKSKRVS